MNSDGNHTDSHRVCGGSDVVRTGGGPTPVCQKGEKCEQFGCSHQHPPGRKADCRFGKHCWNTDCEDNHPLTNPVHHPTGSPEPNRLNPFDFESPGSPDSNHYDGETEWFLELEESIRLNEAREKRIAEADERAEWACCLDPNGSSEREDKALRSFQRWQRRWKHRGRRRH